MNEAPNNKRNWSVFFKTIDICIYKLESLVNVRSRAPLNFTKMQSLIEQSGHLLCNVLVHLTALIHDAFSLALFHIR